MCENFSKTILTALLTATILCHSNIYAMDSDSDVESNSGADEHDDNLSSVSKNRGRSGSKICLSNATDADGEDKDPPESSVEENQGITDASHNPGLVENKEAYSNKQEAVAIKMQAIGSSIGSSIGAVIDDRLGFAPIHTASGGRARNIGIWGKASASVGSQGKTAKISEFKVISSGFTIGADYEIFDDITLGAAYSHIQGKLKYKSSDSRENLSHDIFSFYGKMDIDDPLSIDGNLSYGFSRKSATGDENKHKGNLFLSKINAKYALNIGEILISPKIGADYINIHYENENEKQALEKLSLLGGISISRFWYLDKFKFAPEIHLNVDQKISGKAADFASNQLIQPELNIEDQEAKTSILFGGMLNCLVNGKIELGLGYDYLTKVNFNSHSGYIKIRALF
jgi:outer membrane autotransporter protein